MVLQLNLEHYEFSSSNLDSEKNIVFFKTKGTGGLSHVQRERVGCIREARA